MNLLEQDLEQSQRKITDWLNLYNKASEDIIALNYSSQIHHILDVVACFDPEKIKAIEAESKDEVVVRHLSTIALKIKHSALQAAAPPPEPVKRQPRIAAKSQQKPAAKKEEKSGSFISSVFSRLVSKQKKSFEMILPEKEVNCYYDEKRKMYVFEGEEPEAPKQIPKPPSKKDIVKTQAPKTTSQSSELDNLTAPPTFKRKGTSNNQKNKSRIKQEVLVAPSIEDQPMSFAKVMEYINNQYNLLLEKVRRGAYQRHIPEVHAHNSEELSEFLGVAERVLSSTEQVCQQEQKLIDRWKKSILTEPQELKILEKITKQMGQSGNIYQLINLKLDQVSKEIRSSRTHGMSLGEPVGQLVNLKGVDIQRLELSTQRIAEEKTQLQTTLSLKEAEISMLKDRIEEKTQQNLKLLQQNLRLANWLSQAKKELEEKAQSSSEFNLRMEHTFTQKQAQLQKNVGVLQNENKELAKKVETLKKQAQEARNQKMDIELRLKIAEASRSNDSQRANEEILKEKLKLQAQLKFYEEKEQTFLASIKTLQDQTSFIHECEETLQQQNNLLNSILQRRVQLGRNGETDESLSLYRGQEEGVSPHSVILELSEIISSITQTHLDRLDSFNKNYSHLNKKYLEAKQLVKKIKNTASNENLSLNRSVTRLKSLIQTYKTSKEEAEEKCKLLELECEKLKKNLEHYKQQDKFNKSYLTKLKSSRTANNQNDSIISLQEDNEELAQTIEDLQNEVGLKEENYSKLQRDLEDLLNHYEKNQARLNNIEKKSREAEKEVRLLREEKEDLLNRISLLEVKLTNQREKNEELVRHETAKVKNLEATHEKKIKLLKEDLERAQQAEEDMRAELQQLQATHQRKIAELHAKIEQLNGQLQELNVKLDEKQAQNGELLLLIDETNEKNEAQSRSLSNLQERNEQLERKSVQIANSIRDYNSAEIQALKQSQKSHNEMIKALIAQYKDFEKEESQMRQEYENRIQYLSNELVQSNQQSQQLLRSIEQYSQLVNNLDNTLREMQSQGDFARSEQQRVIQKLQIENSQLTELVTCLQDQIEAKKKEIIDLETLVEKISSESDAFKDKFTELEKEKQDLSERLANIEKQVEIKESEITNKSESLLIKDQELEEKDGILLEREENLVLTREELQGLKNQLQAKDRMIAELQSDLETLAKELAEQQPNDQVSSPGMQSENVLLRKEVRELEERRADQHLKQSQKILALSEAIAEKDAYIVRLEKQVTLGNQINSEQEREIAMLKEGINKSAAANEKIEDEKQEEMKSEMEYLLEEIQNRESQNTELKETIRKLERDLREIVQSKQGSQNDPIQQGQTSVAERDSPNEQQSNQREKEVQGEMEYLMKEIDHKEDEITELKQQKRHLSKQLQEQISSNEQLIEANQTTQGRFAEVEKELQNCKQNEERLKNLAEQLEKQKAYLTQLIETISKQLQSRKASEEGETPTPELIIRLESELKSKSKAITDLEIAKQQTERLLFTAQNDNKDKEATIHDLEGKIGELAEIIQAQEEALSKTSNEEIAKLQQKLNIKELQLLQQRDRTQDLLKVVKQKEGDYELKIESLEREIISLNSLRTANKKLEDNVKALELQNATLLTEKVELLRGNDNLMKINQKLITDMSPQNKLNNKAQPKSEKPNENGNKKPTENTSEGEIKATERKETQKKEARVEERQESRGFFGAISSLFLTPTESERLSKK